jgi:hypothetical protein
MKGRFLLTWIVTDGLQNHGTAQKGKHDIYIYRASNPDLPIVQAKKGKFEVGVHHAPHPSRPFSGIYECMGWGFLRCGRNFVIGELAQKPRVFLHYS